MNWIGTRTLLQREVDRFLEAPVQTIASPLVTTSIYFLVFGFTVDSSRSTEVSYARFIVPGLVFMGTLNTSFVNTSTSVFFSKMTRTLEDLLCAPLGPGEIIAGIVAGGMARGLLIGLLVWVVPTVVDPVAPAFPLETIFYLAMPAYLAAVLGIGAGMWANKFEQVNFFPTFIIMPLTFLGGVFYPVDRLREPLRSLSELNPMVHLVGGLRHGMLGIGPHGGALPMLAWLGVAVVATAGVYLLVRSGYRVRK